MIKTFIIHVSKGYEDRRRHIDSHLPARGITEYEYMLRGDISDLSDRVRNEFFDDSLRLAEKSCFYKHYLVMKEVVERKLPQVLVLEDDAILVEGFIPSLEKVRKEIEDKECYLINIEDAASAVPSRLRKKGVNLYWCKTNKLAGGLLYDYKFAAKMVNYMEKGGVSAPIDGFIGNERRHLAYDIYWCHPPIVTQGSKNGKFSSELNGAKAGIYHQIRSEIKDFYRRSIRSNLSFKHKTLFEKEED